jgi:hypothetical protein
MFRRDEFLDLLGQQNSNETLQRQLKDLEKFVDDELRKIENVVKLINATSATTVALENGLEVVDTLKITNIVHRDITAISETDSKITAGVGADAVSYAVWSDNLTYPNKTSASTTPWNDKTIAETTVSTFTFNGKLRIKCPDNTNKFLAKTLANKYMAIGKTDASGILSGFWSQCNRANTKANLPHPNNVVLADAVRVLYDGTNNVVYLEFKLF